MKEIRQTKPRGIGKKIALFCAGGSFTCSFLTLGLAFWSWTAYGSKHVYTGSLFATVFFFFTAAIVLHEMSKPQLLLEGGEAPQDVAPAMAENDQQRNQNDKAV